MFNFWQKLAQNKLAEGSFKKAIIALIGFYLVLGVILSFTPSNVRNYVETSYLSRLQNSTNGLTSSQLEQSPEIPLHSWLLSLAYKGGVYLKNDVMPALFFLRLVNVILGLGLLLALFASAKVLLADNQLAQLFAVSYLALNASFMRQMASLAPEPAFAFAGALFTWLVIQLLSKVNLTNISLTLLLLILLANLKLSFSFSQLLSPFFHPLTFIRETVSYLSPYLFPLSASPSFIFSPALLQVSQLIFYLAAFGVIFAVLRLFFTVNWGKKPETSLNFSLSLKNPWQEKSAFIFLCFVVFSVIFTAVSTGKVALVLSPATLLLVMGLEQLKRSFGQELFNFTLGLVAALLLAGFINLSVAYA